MDMLDFGELCAQLNKSTIENLSNLSEYKCDVIEEFQHCYIEENLQH